MQEALTPLLSALVTAIAGVIGAWIFARVRSGRSARNLEQGTKILEFIERYCECSAGVEKLSEQAKIETDKLLIEVVKSISEDFTMERSLLPQFEEKSLALRRALLLYFPRRPILWVPHFVFYVLLLFVPFVVAVRVTKGSWDLDDILAILLACLFAGLVRLIVRLVAPKDGPLSRSPVLRIS
jgi:hypothetical protein